MSTYSENEFVTSAGVLWDDPEEGKTWLISLVGIVVLCGLVVFLSVVYFRTEQTEHTAKIVDESWLALQRSKQAQIELLATAQTYEVGDTTKVTRERIPITKAMEAIAANPRLIVPPAAPVTQAPVSPIAGK